MTADDDSRPAPPVAAAEQAALLGELAAELIHDLNGFLQAITSSADLGLAETRDRQTAEIFQDIIKFVGEASYLTKGIMKFVSPVARTEAGDVGAAVVAVQELLGLRIRQATQLHMDWQVAAALPRVVMPTPSLQLVLANLLRNALDAIEDLQEADVRVIARQEGDKVLVEVWNAGPPIPEATLSQIFSPFYTTKPSGRGTGIGLSFVRRLVELAGGQIQARNIGGGVSFEVTLPLSPIPSSQAANGGCSAGSTLDGLEVLLVDDDTHVCDTLRLMISRIGGARVASCYSGEAALRLVGETKFDAILLDLRMPNLSGQEVFNRLSEPFRRRVVFITADTVGALTREFLEGTNQPVLYKPVELGQLLTTLERVTSSPGPAGTSSG
jgi:CheY-like chemotaxis protein